MNSNESPFLASPERMAAALREQGAGPDEIREWMPTLMRLSEWEAPVPAPDTTARLLEELLPHVPALSPVRRALRARRRHLWSDWTRILELARIQVSVLRPSFWVLSAVVALLGALLPMSRTSSNEALLLLAIGPLWSYLGALSVFRGAELNVLELELACPPSTRQLIIARLVVVLSYDVLLGLGLSLLLRSQGEEGMYIMTAHWLAPLLLVAGVTLLLSLRIPVNQAASVAYGGWLCFLLLVWLVGENDLSVTFTLGRDLMLASTGILCMALAVYSIGRATPWLPPHRP